MDNKKIIIAIIILVILITGGGLVLFNTISAKEPVKIEITSNETLNEGDKLSIKLTDLNNSEMGKEIVNITITDKNGKVVVDEVVKTNSKGNAKIDLKLKKGAYNVTVSYGGNQNYSGNNTTQKLKIKEKVEENQSSSSSSTTNSDDYIYSPQQGKYIKKSGQWDKDSKGNSIHTYQGRDGALYERIYDSKGREINPNDYYG